MLIIATAPCSDSIIGSTEGLASYILLAAHGTGAAELERDVVMKGADWSPFQLEGRTAHLYLTAEDDDQVRFGRAGASSDRTMIRAMSARWRGQARGAAAARRGGGSLVVNQRSIAWLSLTQLLVWQASGGMLGELAWVGMQSCCLPT